MIAYDKDNWFLKRQPLTPETLWNKVEQYIEKWIGWLILDDTVIDKIHSDQTELIQYQWNGKYHTVVKGIGLIPRIWTDGINTVPICDQIYAECHG